MQNKLHLFRIKLSDVNQQLLEWILTKFLCTTTSHKFTQMIIDDSLQHLYEIIANASSTKKTQYSEQFQNLTKNSNSSSYKCIHVVPN